MNSNKAQTLLLQFIGSLTLCEHMGDVGDAVDIVLRRLGLEDLRALEWDELGTALGRMGVTTLYGTSLLDDEELPTLGVDK